MSNKKIGTDFEREVCKYLKGKGFWVHFLVPDARGAQPFDIIAVRDGVAYAIDCKTCAANSIGINRLEVNQIMAFERWIKCENYMPLIAVKHKEQVYWVRYDDLKKEKRIMLDEYSQRGRL